VIAKPTIEVSVLLRQYSITATPQPGIDPMGYITPSGTTPVDCGSSITYDIFTETGHRIAALYVDGDPVPVPAYKTYTFSNVQTNHTIHAEFEEFPHYIIQFGPSAAQQQGGAVYPTHFPNAVNYIAVDSGMAVFPFSIVPAQGFEIDKVFVDGVLNAPAAIVGSYTFYNLNANHTIFATFKPTMFTITATAGPNGIITPSGTVPVAYGNDQSFHAIPNTGSNLSAIYVDGVLDADASETGVYTFESVAANHTISAFFTKKTYLITTIAGAFGAITPHNPSVEHGDNVTLTFIPQTGYKVNQVFINGIENPAAVLAGAYTFLNVTQDHTVEVTFTKVKFTITASATGGGFITPSGVSYVDYGDHSEIYVFVANNGYQIQSVFIDGINDALAIQNGMYRFMDVTANHTIHVVFAPSSYTIVATVTAGGSINPAGIITVPLGVDRVFYFAAFEGYKVARVMIDGINNEQAVQDGFYTFYNVSSSHTIAVQCEKKKYDVYWQEVTGAVLTPVEGSVSPVEHGGKYKFVVEVMEGYTQSNITVRANNIIINPIGGIYTINNIIIDQEIIISDLEINQYKITAKTNTGGTVSPLGIFMVTHGDSRSFDIIPDDDYIIEDIMVNGMSVGDVVSYIFADIRADGIIEAFFKYNVGIIENDGATVTVFSHRNIVTIMNENLLPVKHVEIMDMYGRLVWTGPATDSKTEITLDVAKGMYAVRIITEDYQNLTTKIVIY
jgi:hypothetical protein